MVNQFASIWAVKSDHRRAVGEVIPVALKSGAIKNVEIAQFLYEEKRKNGDVVYYHLAAKNNEN